MSGILNGIDTRLWDPANDPYLDAPFSTDVLSGKASCKAALQHGLGLPVDAGRPLVGFIGRLDPQKGIELLLEAIPPIVRENGAQFAILGSAAASHAHYEQRLRELQRAFPASVCVFIGFSERLAHRIEAGADLFVMPSLFEPCGLSQMYSLRYGTVPVVRATGGLADSVEQVDTDSDSGTGFLFPWFDARNFIDTLRHALWVWRTHPALFERIRKRGMQKDFSWDSAVARYEEVYRQAAAARGVIVGDARGSPKKKKRKT